jgi:transglutaminase-like putative cysteine protease
MSATPLRLLHRKLAAGMGLAATIAFMAGAGLDSLMPLFTIAILTIALFWAPPAYTQKRLDYVWRVIALVFALRAIYHILTSPEDIVLPMVDLLLLLLASETWRESGAAGDTRVYSLSFALLIASSAYRPGILFALSFVAYAGLAVVTLMVGHLIRKLAHHDARDVRLERAFLFRIAALSGVMLALSAVVFAAFPRVSRGWMTRTALQTSSIVGFSDRVSIGEHGSSITANPEVVLRVEFPDGAPENASALYWRGRSYDFFDGTAWARSSQVPRTLASTGFYSARWPGPRVTQRIFAISLDVPVIFGLHPVLLVQPNSRMRPMSDNAGDLWYAGGGTPSYTIVSAAQPPSADDLRGAYGENARGQSYYLQLPTLAPRIHALADSLTRNATTRYDSVFAVQQWLRTQFSYTLNLPATAREATLDHFLFERRAGHCEYFSTALAVLLRSVGIPTRNVNGFLGGSWNQFGQFLTVSQNQAHSWVEVWFPRYGWVTFDGTPAATAEVARPFQNWLGPLRTIVDGLEHRWNKWILEYNLETQLSLFQRATDPFMQRGQSPETQSTPPRSWRWLRTVFLLAIVAGALWLLHTVRAGSMQVRSEARGYLRLRRAYERAGYAFRAHDAPLAFLTGLRSAGAPGLVHAERVVDGYLRARFSAAEVSAEEKRAVALAVESALRALRAQRAGPLKRAVEA